jgi:predicted N-acetyltransferase YhbS
MSNIFFMVFGSSTHSLMASSFKPSLSAHSIDDASTEAATTVGPEGSPGSASVAGTERGTDVASSTAPLGQAKQSTVVLHNVSVNGPDADASLLREVRRLCEAAFDEDCLPDITKKSKWQLSLLVSSDLASLYGFIVSKVANGCLSIAKLAVAPELRGRGLGRRFMDEVLKAAKRRGDVYEACLSSRGTAVSFYKRLGFKADTSVKLKVDFEVEEGQVYMEKRLRQRPRRQK